MNEYQKMKEKHQAEVNAFPLQFAFNQEQFVAGMRALGLKPTDTHKVYKLGNTGGFYRKSDSDQWRRITQNHEMEFLAAVAADKTGDGFIFDMFNYELANHEYRITYDTEDALAALGFTEEDVARDARLLHGLEKACAENVKEPE